MPIAPDFKSIHSVEWEVNFLQCNPNGYLKQTELCNLLQLTAAAHSETGGMSFTEMQQHNQAWVLSRMRVEIEKMPQWRDIVTIKTWITDLHGSRSVRALEVWLNNEKIIGAVTYWVVFNTKLRKSESLALPHDHLEKYPEKLATETPFAKLDLNKEVKAISERTVALSDLDIVFHVNNVKYLEWCLDAVDYKLLLRQQLKSFDMNFLRELKLNDDVVLHTTTEDKSTFFKVTKNDKPSFALALNWK